MNPILVVSGTEKGSSVLTDLLKAEGYTQIETTESAAEARRRVSAANFYLVIINMPLIDETGKDLALQLAQGNAAVLVIVKAGKNEFSCYNNCEQGIYLLTKPLNRQGFHNALVCIRNAQYRIDYFKKKNKELLKTIEDIKVIHRAKCLLITDRGLTEDEAHRHIEKNAMDLRLTKRQVAERILATH